MDIIKKLNELRLQRNMSVYRLAELSGLNQSTLANTFSRGIVPSIRNLETICEAMGITMGQFFTESEREEILTEEEISLIDNFRRLPPHVKKAFCEMVNACAREN